MVRIVLLAIAIGSMLVAGYFAEPPRDGGPQTAATTNSLSKESFSSVGTPMLMSPHSNPIGIYQGMVFVANTPANTLDVFESDSRTLIDRIPVGIQPVGVAIRPDGKEIWVANHVSDSVSVIDNDSTSKTFREVVATIQELDAASRSTRFDEPVAIAFASNEKAYVSLSSENKIAVVNVDTRRVENRLNIRAQDPRAITVRNGHLYVLPFESNNQTQLSGGTGKLDGELATFDAVEHSISNNNVLSLGAVVDIVKHPKVPDRDLFIFDTRTDKLVETVSSLGTLLYGLAVDSKGTVFIAQTDARNDINGKAGTKKHGLAELQNRPFLNRITRVDFPENAEAKTDFIDLEPLPPSHPVPGNAYATPFAIQVTDDDSILIVTASGSDKLFTVDAKTGQVLSQTQVGAVPEGVAIESREGRATNAWVLNAASNTVSVVDVSNPKNIAAVTHIPLEDPTHPTVKRGRIAFSTARASTTGTFSCASCHPDGHTDQLLWVLNTPIVTGGDQIMPRSTMPVRGLRDTAPFHWDGVPGDPYGDINSASVHKGVAPNSDIDRPESSARHLIDGGLASTMSMPGDDYLNDEGKAGRLSASERDDMSVFLLNVPYPPAQRRAYSNELSSKATEGFRLFHIDGDLDPSKPAPNVCGDCHRMPFWVSTNTPGTGMDTPTWRGAYDRWLILPQGRLNIIDFDFYRDVAEKGTPERNVWQFSWAGRARFDPVWDMVLEGCTGFPGAYARQVTMNRESASDSLSLDLLQCLEASATEDSIDLVVHGVFLEGSSARRAALKFVPSDDKDLRGQGTQQQASYYAELTKDHEPTRDAQGTSRRYSTEELLKIAREGKFIGTFTGNLGRFVDADNPQPALWTLGPIEKQRGHQIFPTISQKNTQLRLSARHLRENPILLVDGHRVLGSTRIEGQTLEVEFSQLPPVGMHFLQLQNRDGLISNDFIFHVADPKAIIAKTDSKILGEIIRANHMERLLGEWVDIATKGETLKLTYSWKIQERVIEATSKQPDNQSVALISFDAGSEKVTHIGSDQNGSSVSGDWVADASGDALLSIVVTNANREKGSMQFRFHFIDDDHIEITVLSTPNATIVLERAKNP